MSTYNWKAIPEATWTAFAAAFAGLAGALMVVAGAPDMLVVAVVTFIGAFFRLLVSLLAAFGSSEGTVTMGRETDTPPIPPSE